MAFFNNYAKPGKGVEKDEKRPIGFIMFFVLLGRKFGSYVKLSLLYTLTLIPSILTLFFVISSFVFDIASQSLDDANFVVLISLALAIALSAMFSLSPLSSGFYYILRNFAREEHAWLSDFFGIFKDNLKHSLLTWVIDSAIVIIALLSLRIYFVLSFVQNSYFLIPLTILLIVFVIFALSAVYRWTAMVTFEGKLIQNYKNSIFFVLGNTWRSFAQFFFSLIGVAVIFIGSFLFSAIAYLVMAIIGFSMYGLIQAISIYPVIAKYTNGETEE